MVGPVRHKKPITHSWRILTAVMTVSATAPLNKKPRTTPKELKLETRKSKLKNLQKEDILVQEKTPKKKRMILHHGKK
uniref:Uncharacterized protein n=1 Tax=Neovison vison TaxID=452646 RepID=A0A8C7BRM4_NEOVI